MRATTTGYSSATAARDVYFSQAPTNKTRPLREMSTVPNSAHRRRTRYMPSACSLRLRMHCSDRNLPHLTMLDKRKLSRTRRGGRNLPHSNAEPQTLPGVPPHRKTNRGQRQQRLLAGENVLTAPSRWRATMVHHSKMQRTKRYTRPKNCSDLVAASNKMRTSTKGPRIQRQESLLMTMNRRSYSYKRYGRTRKPPLKRRRDYDAKRMQA